MYANIASVPCGRRNIRLPQAPRLQSSISPRLKNSADALCPSTCPGQARLEPRAWPGNMFLPALGSRTTPRPSTCPSPPRWEAVLPRPSTCPFPAAMAELSRGSRAAVAELSRWQPALPMLPAAAEALSRRPMCCSREPVAVNRWHRWPHLSPPVPAAGRRRWAWQVH